MKHAGVSTLFPLGLAVMLLLTVTVAPVMAADENPGANEYPVVVLNDDTMVLIGFFGLVVIITTFLVLVH